MIARPLTLAGILLLAACQSSPTLTPTVIDGQATYRERIAAPPGARLRVQLIDNLLADTPKAILADQEFEAASGPPFAFRLPYDAATLRANGQYGLHASLRDASGQLLFTSDTRVPVQPGQSATVTIPMIRVARTVEAAQVSHWQCGDRQLQARFTTDAVTLETGASPLVLPHAMSASGARYADAQGNEFWTKGPQGRLTVAGQPALDCRQIPPQASVWEAAKARGVAFRAVGNEPGWWVELGADTAHPLVAQLDYGQRQLQVATLATSGSRYTGTATTGEDVQLEIHSQPCGDTMSDETFPTMARLQVDGKTYQGCGRYLDR